MKNAFDVLSNGDFSFWSEVSVRWHAFDAALAKSSHI
jgi:hypothetical protein